MNTSHNQTEQPATKPAHTPTPWTWHKDTSGLIHIGRPLTSGKFAPAWAVATIDNLQREDEANAALIVRAVNSHVELVAALEEAEAVISGRKPAKDSRKGRERDSLAMIRAALAKAQS